MSARRLDATALRAWAHAAVGGLSAHLDEINRLNVFPVADADTGTNMLFTMRSAGAHVDELGSADQADVVAVAAALTRGALQGARGNSGVILSQILRGFSEITAATDGQLTEIDAGLFAAALRRAVGFVLAAVGDPQPGTVITVLEEAAAAAERAVADGADLVEAVDAAADAAAVALDKTTAQLDVLADAGVVDAGGRGLLVLLDAMSATLTGRVRYRPPYEPAPAADSAPGAGRPAAAAVPQFEVMYLLSGCDAADADRLRRRLSELGDSVAVAAASDGGEYSVHVHTDDAGAAIEAALPLGRLRRIQISALPDTALPDTGLPDTGPRATPSAPARHSAEHSRSVLAVVDGAGAAELFCAEGAHVLMVDDRPIDADRLLRAMVELDAARVMVLPNGYVPAEELVAACTAAGERGVDVVPLPAASMVQGLAALALHDAGRHAVDDGYQMAQAAAAARHGAVRIATEEALTWAGRCKPGDGLGISNGEVLIVAEDVVSAGAGLIDLLLAAGGELVTVLTGSGVDGCVGEALRRHVHEHHPGSELVVYRTGHRGDALLIGVE
ncbi:DAK2 domain fusion YloV family protein [Mycolicibacterium hassiacum DSM 44199]|jgi:hypothetical protein|uniref:DAK2 domain fusion YloV family protein n=1 Tax=Mycolicibacterium hassiacum (strain DSM 44199 / CIP 105218 / JCM 12690 / 3849) TaxID=1122247 RepID=K5BGV3_MYCHD|nr:DAK2 domain-containing protein [Mycolicibacterium hassiacum]EKF24316.1 DAK2 domain fusion YloV family protein [Mycolicibacterium hassiacum DSM 44199]MBX5485845.1 DAK2 domain-containing protein [Mycolicibacterium hassiacum]VCT89273.1 hypothetical protein MHAS_00963 [Mycolicibacterium hassiacum DSM 44199]